VSSGERKRIEPKPVTCDTCQGLRYRGREGLLGTTDIVSGSEKAVG